MTIDNLKFENPKRSFRLWALSFRLKHFPQIYEKTLEPWVPQA